MCCYAEMKTGKYTTTKKSKNKKQKEQLPPEIAVVADLASTYIASWTKRELQRLQQETKPLCIPIKDGYMVGKFTIKKLPTEQWQVTDCDNLHIHDFYYKLGSILYAVFNSKNQLVAAKEVLTLDREYSKHDNDIRMYKYNITRALANKNYFLYDKLVARLDLSKQRKQIVGDELTRIFARAKFYKIWE